MPQTEQPLRLKPDHIKVLYDPMVPDSPNAPNERRQFLDRLVWENMGKTPEVLIPRVPAEEHLSAKDRLIRRHVENLLLKEWGPTRTCSVSPTAKLQTQAILRHRYFSKPVADFLDPIPKVRGDEMKNLPDWAAARDLLLEAVAKDRAITVFGDFDCDGVCSVTLMLDLLKGLGARPDNLRWFVPHRLDHGYGVTKEALKLCLKGEAHSLCQPCSVRPGRPRRAGKPQLLVVVDCGTNEAKLLNSALSAEMAGVRALVIDHHQLHNKDGRTDHVPLLNPWAFKEFEHSDLRGLCASGLIYLLALSLKEFLGRWNQDRAAILAGLASVADVMPMLGLTRSIVKNAIRLARTQKLKYIAGLYFLHDILMLARYTDPQFVPPVDEDTFGFLWGPCLNASGRIDKDCATASIELLTHRKRPHLERLAGFVYEANCQRINTQLRILKQAEQQAVAQVQYSKPARIILTAGHDWHPGVVGIVASRLRDLHNRPAIVCGWSQGDNCWRGSGRSLEGFHIGNMVKEAKKAKLLASGGGHEMACGLKLQADMRPVFQTWVQRHCKRKEFSRTQDILAKAEDFDALQWHDIKERLRPFGRKHEEIRILLQDARLESASLRLYRRPSPPAAPEGPPPLIDPAAPLMVDLPTDGTADPSLSNTRKPVDAKAFGPAAKGVAPPGRSGSRYPHKVWTAHEKRRMFAELRRGELSGLIIGTFVTAKTNRQITAAWFNVRRALREWRVGGFYSLHLGTYVSRSSGRRVGRFTVLNCWEEQPRSEPPPAPKASRG